MTDSLALCLFCGSAECEHNPPNVGVASSEMGVHFSSANDSWSTPSEVYRALDAEFAFDHDPCPLNANPTTDGLKTNWGRCNFVNPPYSDLGAWISKSFQEWQKGKTVVLLIPSRTDTRAWHDYCLRASEIRFIKGRLKFGNAKNCAPFPSAIVVFRAQEAVK